MPESSNHRQIHSKFVYKYATSCSNIFFLPYIFQELVQLKGRKLREPEAKERRLNLC